MEPHGMNGLLVSLDAAWLCAAERDVEREEEERMRSEKRSKMQSLSGKYELDAMAQLDADLKHQQLELRRRVTRRKHQQQAPAPPLTHLPLLVSTSTSLRAPPHSPQEQQRQHRQDRKPKDKPSVYELENQRLAALVSHHRQPNKPTRMKTVIQKKPKPRIVEDMLALERRYALSARRLQRWWRSLSRRRFWKSYFLKVRAATQIQRVIRGFVCRCVVLTWHRNRTHRATRIQAALRGFLWRKAISAWMQWEYVNVVRMQAIVRGHFARRRVVKRRCHVAALHIQCLWRGWQSRRHSDLLWLGRRAVGLQRLVRGVQTRKRVRRRRLLYNDAATQIQRCFRGAQARVVVGSMLRDRETANRLEWMHMLEAEEEWHRQQRDRLQARLDRFKLLEQLCELEEHCYRAHERVNDMEAIYQDMQTQRLRVSPRAIEHGWVEEMEHKMRLQRKAITAAKLEAVFELGLRFKQKEEEYVAYVERIRSIEDKRRRFEIARAEEFLDYWERECKHHHQVKELERKRRIGDTKRRWHIQFYRLNGKKDMRWRGTHWTNDVLEGAKQREVFSLSNTNLLAEIQAKWRAHLQRQVRPDQDTDEEVTRGRLHELEEQVELATVSAQTQQTVAVFDPVFREIEARFTQVKRRQEHNERKATSHRARREAAAHESKREEEAIHLADPHKVKSNLPERQLKLRRAMQAARIPWHMLDHLAAERRKVDEEKTLFRAWRTVPRALFPSQQFTEN